MEMSPWWRNHSSTTRLLLHLKKEIRFFFFVSCMLLVRCDGGGCWRGGGWQIGNQKERIDCYKWPMWRIASSSKWVCRLRMWSTDLCQRTHNWSQSAITASNRRLHPLWMWTSLNYCKKGFRGNRRPVTMTNAAGWQIVLVIIAINDIVSLTPFLSHIFMVGQ